MSQQKTFFLLATLFAVIGTAFLSIPLLAYAPYLAYTLMRHSLKKTLWHSLFCGVIMDTLQSTLPFGYSSLGLCLVSLILYRQKWWFFNDKLFSLSFFSAFFSFLFSFFQLGILSIEKKPLLLSWMTLCTDFILMPLCDGLYAFIWFTGPYLIYNQIKKHGFNFLFIKKLD